VDVIDSGRLEGSVLLTRMYNNTGSVLAAADCHAGMNSIGASIPPTKQRSSRAGFQARGCTSSPKLPRPSC